MSQDPRSKPTKTAHHLVQFTWGELDPEGPFVERYTDWTSDVTAFGHVWESIPEALIKVAPYTGVFGEEPTRIETFVATEFLKRISSGEPFAKVTVDLYERYRSGVETLEQLRFHGRIDHCIRNKDGNQNAIEVVCRTFKDVDLVVPWGLFGHGDCVHTFGDHNCGVIPIVDTGTLIKIQKHRVQIVGLPSPPWPHWWFNGWVQREGLRIRVRQTSGGGGTFLLSKPAPQAWLNQTVYVQNGCRKKPWSCREYDNESEFGGYGIAMPEYHPAFEQPTE